MAIDLQNKKFLLCQKEREDFLKGKLGLGAINCQWKDAGANLNAGILREQGVPEQATLFIDLMAVEAGRLNSPSEWKDWHIVLLMEGGPTVKANEWLKACSHLNLNQLNAYNLPLHELAGSQEKYPGISFLLGKGSEVLFQKVQELGDIGEKIDRVIAKLEKKYPKLIPHLFNLRHLTYSVLHHALNASMSVGKKIPLADFQIGADENQIIFATRFNSPENSMVDLNRTIVDSRSILWQNAANATDLLVFTELSRLRQMEIKAVVSAKGELSSGGASILIRKVEDFAPDDAAQGRLRQTSYAALDALPSKTNGSQEESQNSSAHVEETTNEESNGTGLNFKVKADMLENEKNNLQNLVKKKNALIGGLTKDVNRAQIEAQNAHKAATKEIMKMRMELEKEKNLAREATKKLLTFQRMMEQKEAVEANQMNRQEEQKDFEIEWKKAEIQRNALEEKMKELTEKLNRNEELMRGQRANMNEVSAKLNEEKAKNLKLERESRVQANENTGSASTIEVNGTNERTEIRDQANELRKSLTDSKVKEQELEKEIRRLTIKAEGAEKNLKVHDLTASKQLEAAEKAAAEAKRLKSKAMEEIEAMKVEMKQKAEAANAAAREIKKKADDLSEALRLKSLECEKLTKELAGSQARSTELAKKAS
jgi:hypothetical protein